MEETNPSEQKSQVRLFIQARMSSSRFPGKVLAPFQGKPIVAQVIGRVAQALPLSQITVLTSVEESDDPLALYVDSLGCRVFRGPLEAVFTRFQLCLQHNPCDWFMRISADSPLMDSSIIRRILELTERQDLDVVTNVFPRTFPKGHSCEMVRSSVFAALDAAKLSAEEQEHVTKVFYNSPDRYKIYNIESSQPEAGKESLAVDTLDDYYRLLARPQSGS